MVWMVFKTRPINFFYTRMCFQILSNFASVVAVALHAQMQVLMPRNTKKQSMRSGVGTAGIQDEIKSLVQFIVIYNQRAHYHIAVASQVFCNAVHYNIGTQQQWIL
jgi:predicted DNA-binding protein (UPF0278 family)